MFRVQSGAGYVIDTTVDPPVIVLDTSEKLFHCTEIVEGNISVPARSAFTFNGSSRVPFNTDGNYFVSAVNALADIVLGGFQVVTSGGGFNALGVFDAGGSYVHYQQGPPNFSNGVVSNTDVTSMAVYTFFASGGGLYLNERVYLDAGAVSQNVTLTRTLLGITFYYKLFVGTLT